MSQPPAAAPPTRPSAGGSVLSNAVMIGLCLAACLALFFIRKSGPRFSEEPGAPALPVLHEVPTFGFVDQGGGRFGTDQLRGRVWAAAVIFTRCASICPRITRDMVQLQHLTADLDGRFQLVSFSADPAHDTPEVLAAYAAETGARTGNWAFLTGDRTLIQQTVTGGLKLHLADEVEDGPVPDIAHSPHLVLVDGGLRVRGYYDSGDADAMLRLSRDARRLARDLPPAAR